MTHTNVKRSQRSNLKTWVRQDRSRRMSVSEVDGVQRSSVKSLDLTDVSFVIVGHVL